LENVSLKDPNGELVASMEEFHLDVNGENFSAKNYISRILS
jgi:hypothetical protein